MRSRIGLHCRRVLPIAALSTGTFFTVAHCDSFESYKGCASIENVYAPHSPEAGLTFEQSGHWQALSNSCAHLMHTFKNCSELHLKFLRNWENHPTEHVNYCSKFRYSFPPKLKPGEATCSVMNTQNPLNAASVFLIEGTNQIVAFVYHTRRPEKKKDYVTTVFLPKIKAVGVYVGDMKTPAEIWDLVYGKYGDTPDGVEQTFQGENYSLAYSIDGDVSVEHTFSEEMKVRLAGKFHEGVGRDSEFKMVLEQL